MLNVLFDEDLRGLWLLAHWAKPPPRRCSGRPIKPIAHDGSVTFTTYDAKGRDTEGASFATATTRPALAHASKVVSTKWQAIGNLPTQLDAQAA